MSRPLAGTVVQVALPAKDLAAATAFYRDVLGLPLLFETGGMAFFDAGSVRLMLGPVFSQDRTKSGGVIYFQPDDLKRAVEELTRRGVPFLGMPQTLQKTEPGDLLVYFFKDPDENLLALMGEIARD